MSTDAKNLVCGVCVNYAMPSKYDTLNFPDHANFHRIMAMHEAAPVKSLTIDASGNLQIDGTLTVNGDRIASDGNLTIAPGGGTTTLTLNAIVAGTNVTHFNYGANDEMYLSYGTGGSVFMRSGDNTRFTLDASGNLTIAGTLTLAGLVATAGLDIGAYSLTALNFISDVATTTAPYACTSTTLNTNLNADYCDSKHVGTSGNTIPLLDGTNTWSADQTVGDNIKRTFGTGGDADIYYSGTALVINPKVVGSGGVIFDTDSYLAFRGTSATLHSPSSAILRYTVTGLGARHEWYSGVNELMRIGVTIGLGNAGAGNYIQVSNIGNMYFYGSAGFYPRRIRQAAIPAAGTGATQIDTAEMMIWEDSDDDSVHLVYNDVTAGIKSVALT